jgi:hypothetical protein
VLKDFSGMGADALQSVIMLYKLGLVLPMSIGMVPTKKNFHAMSQRYASIVQSSETADRLAMLHSQQAYDRRRSKSDLR